MAQASLQVRRVAALLRRGRCVLLCHRSPHRQWYPDTWDLPTGQVRDHERPPAALARELASQLDIDIAPQPLDPFAHVQGVGFRMDIWVVDHWFGTPTQQDPREYDALAWVDLDHAQNLELADPRLLTLVKAVLTTPQDYPEPPIAGAFGTSQDDR